MQRKVERLSGHYIICAYGRVGRAVARHQARERLNGSSFSQRSAARG